MTLLVYFDDIISVGNSSCKIQKGHYLSRSNL